MSAFLSGNQPHPHANKQTNMPSSFLSSLRLCQAAVWPKYLSSTNERTKCFVGLLTDVLPSIKLGLLPSKPKT